MAATDDWAIDYRPGGWARARRDDVTVYLKLGADNDARRDLHICAAALTADRPITEAVWRSVPIAMIENLLKILSYLAASDFDRMFGPLAESVTVDGYPVEALARYFAETEPMEVGMTVSGQPRLDRPAGGRLTDQFLREVAAIYLTAITEKKAPAPVVAEVAGVPVRTVHRWVAEARRRGVLPQATKGRAG